ncbi:MAG: hypothetical protein NC818_00635 [Candidatus Omnitrophica bacterium]|nr:hypothetical protein [Candidatus Omnitrophota bacterium]
MKREFVLFIFWIFLVFLFLNTKKVYPYFLEFWDKGREWLNPEMPFCSGVEESEGVPANVGNLNRFLSSIDNMAGLSGEDTDGYPIGDLLPKDYDFFWEEMRFINAPDYLRIPTYDGSGQAVHPDIVYFPQGWQGYAYWMVFTPYPWSKRSFENPSIVASHDGFYWEVPPGLKNPIVERVNMGYHADPDLIYNQETNELWIYFMRFKDNKSYLFRIRSSDGINWTQPELILWEPFFGMLSPSIVYREGVYHLWYVDSGRQGINASHTEVKYRTSYDGVNWSQASKVNINIDGIQIWHLEVNYILSQGEFWMFFPGFKEGTSADRTDLYFARTNNPLNWTTLLSPVLTRGTGKIWDNTRIYQTSFIYDEETQEIHLWYSAGQKVWKVFYIIPYPTYQWRIGYTSLKIPLVQRNIPDLRKNF